MLSSFYQMNTVNITQTDLKVGKKLNISYIHLMYKKTSE